MKVEARGYAFDVTIGGPAGETGAPVLLLHGFPQNSAMWDRVAPILHVSGFATIAMDQRGYSPGARPADPAAYAMTELTADVIAVLDELGATGAHVVGHDWGSIVAWHLAASRPDLVRTLTAVSVPHPAAFGGAVASDPDQARRSAYIQLFRQPGKAEDVLLADGGSRMRAMFAGCPDSRVDTYIEAMSDRAALTAMLNWYRAMTPGTMACGPVAVPTTYVWGEGDLAVGAVAAHDCAAHVTGAYTFLPLSDVSHWIPDEAPEVLAEAILARIRG